MSIIFLHEKYTDYHQIEISMLFHNIYYYNLSMLWFLLTLSAAFCWAVGQIFLKKGFEHICPLWNNIFNNILSLFIYLLPALLISKFEINTPSIIVIIFILTASMLYLGFFYSISRGQISLTGTIVSGYPIITIILSYIFLKEHLTLMQYGGIALILSGGVFVALPDKTNHLKIKHSTWVLWGLIGALALGTGDFFTKLSVNSIGSYSHMVFLALVSNATSGLNYLLDKRNRKAPKIFHKNFTSTFTGLVIQLIGAFFFILAFDYGKVSLVTSVSSVYPALMVLLAVKFLNDKINRIHSIGIGVTVCGLIIIGLGSR
jgi:uncharacterized membrane protein